MEQGRRSLREYWVKVRIDGTEWVIKRVADGAESACREFLRDLHRGGRQHYQTEDGQLTVEWGNVATLNVGPVVHVVRITPDDAARPPGTATA
jgi:hypothetical protein